MGVLEAAHVAAQVDGSSGPFSILYCWLGYFYSGPILDDKRQRVMINMSPEITTIVMVAGLLVAIVS
ncbi:unnamed protein product, partial [marine sediment metagenome]